MRWQHLLFITFRNIVLGGLAGSGLALVLAGSDAISTGLILGLIAGVLGSAISVWSLTLREDMRDKQKND